MSSVGPGWVDHHTSHIAGLFPLAVERYYNSAMAAHAPAVTTVTATARYYSLHGYLAATAVKEGWDSSHAKDTLRRAEATMALVSIQHESEPSHRAGGTIHGADKLRPLLAAGEIDLRQAIRTGGPGYAMGEWGFWGPYRGAEIRLGIVDPTDLGPGKNAHTERFGNAFPELLDLARRDGLDVDALRTASAACVCQVATDVDGRWLSELFAGHAGAGESIGGRQHQTMRLIETALKSTAVTSVEDVARFIKYHPEVLADPVLSDMPVARVWRGLCLRADSVDAWRRLWAQICGQIRGVVTRDELADWLAEKAPLTSLGVFIGSLPATTSGHDMVPRDAESEVAALDLDPELRAIATVLLGGKRYGELGAQEMLGFRGHPGLPAAREELSPAWVALMSREWEGRDMRDFCRHLAHVLVNRSQRVAMMKSRFDGKTGRFVMPSRVRVHDDHVVKLFNENATRPAFLVRQLLELGTQLDIFERDPSTGQRGAGPRIEVLS